MPNYVTEIRYAVARDEVQRPERPRQWWQLKSEKFDTEWWERRTFERKASALAIIWKHRDQDHMGSYKFTLFRVVRRFLAPPKLLTKTPDGPAPQQEARVP